MKYFLMFLFLSDVRNNRFTLIHNYPYVLIYKNPPAKPLPYRWIHIALFRTNIPLFIKDDVH